MKKRLPALFLAFVFVFSLFTGCDANKKKERTVVTVLYNEKLENFESYIEEKLSDIDLEWEHLASSPLDSTVSRRMAAGHGPDLVISTQPADEENSAYVLPLDGYDFSARYESTMLKNLFVDGRLYYLPMPGQYNCFVINKTLFEDEGIPLPTTDDELIAALTELQGKGVGRTDTGHVFGLREADNVTVGTFLVGCMVPDFLGTAQGVRWLTDYEDKQVSMSGTWEPAFSFMQQLVDLDLMNVMPFSRQGNAPNNAVYMSQGKLAAAYGSSAFLAECRQLNAQEVEAGTSPAYEYEMLPFFGENGAQNWTLARPADYIGVNSALQEAGNEEKLDACLRVMEALSTQEGQESLMKDLRLDNSYLKGFNTQGRIIPDGLEEVVADGYVYYSKFQGRVVEYLGAQGKLFLGGKKTAADCLTAVDDYYLNGSEDVDQDLSLVGSVAQDLIYQSYNSRMEETALGNLVADSVAAYSGASIAVINGGGVRASLFKGDVLGEDLNAVCPYDNQITVVRMSGEVVWQMLENGLSALKPAAEVPGGRFLQVSGMKYTFDGSKPVGERLQSVNLADGTPIEKTERYEVAITNYMAGSNGYLEGNGDGYTMLNLYSDADPVAEDVELVKENGGTYRDALRFYFAQSGETAVTSEVEGRIVNVAAN